MTSEDNSEFWDTQKMQKRCLNLQLEQWRATQFDVGKTHMTGWSNCIFGVAHAENANKKMPKSRIGKKNQKLKTSANSNNNNNNMGNIASLTSKSTKEEKEPEFCECWIVEFEGDVVLANVMGQPCIKPH